MDTSFNHPRISVIVPVYNVAAYIETCVRSLLAQTFSAFEILLVDDCGTDDSVAIAEGILRGQQHIAWSTLRHEQNKGLSEARNTGINAARGTYIVFVDSDDWVPPAMLERFVETASEHPASIICGNTIAVTNDIQEPYWFEVMERVVFSKQEGIKRMLSYDQLLDTAWAKMFPVRLFRETNIRFPAGLYFEDTPTNLRLFNNAESIVAIPHTVYYYRRSRPDSILQQRSFKTAQDRLKVFEDIYSYLSSSAVLDETYTTHYYLNRLVGEYRNIFKDYKLTHAQQQQLAKEISEKILKFRREHRNMHLRRIIGIKFSLLLKRKWYKNMLIFLFMHNDIYSIIDLLIDCYIF